MSVYINYERQNVSITPGFREKGKHYTPRPVAPDTQTIFFKNMSASEKGGMKTLCKGQESV